jgi:hypothetical protein
MACDCAYGKYTRNVDSLCCSVVSQFLSLLRQIQRVLLTDARDGAAVLHRTQPYIYRHS